MAPGYDYSDYTWGGWYADSALQNPYTFGTMPGNNLVLYAKWIAPNFSVSFADTVVDAENITTSNWPENQTVEKYKKVEKPADPTKTGHAFDGWYTTADGDTLFDWNTKITADTTIYAHWIPKNLTYIVHYIDKDTGKSIFPDKIVTDPDYVVGQSVPEFAIAIAGYRPTKTSQSIILSLDDADNDITFEYTKKVEKTSYTVRYVIPGDPDNNKPDIPVANEKTVNNVSGDIASVIERAATVDNEKLEAAGLSGNVYYPDETQKSFTLTANTADNVFYFYYSPYKTAAFTVRYVDMDGNSIPEISASPKTVKVGGTFTINRPSIQGWELVNDSSTPTEIKYTENYNGPTEFTLQYKKKATITARSYSKQYDGTALMLPADLNGQVVFEGLVEGDTLTAVSFSYTGNDVDAGQKKAGIATVTPRNASDQR